VLLLLLVNKIFRLPLEGFPSLKLKIRLLAAPL
jgi:hypothetical protein